MKKNFLSVFTNFGLLLFGFLMSFSGLLLQAKYHIGNHGKINVNDTYFKMNYWDWSSIHKGSIILFSALIILHVFFHYNWYKTVITNKLFLKNKITIILTVIFIFAAVTGYVPWFIMLTDGLEITRKVFIEIHDKLAIILLVLLILHVVQKRKWFFSSLKNLNFN